MDAVALAGKLNKALGKGAGILGLPFDVYRPLSPMAPLANKVIPGLKVSFSQNYNYASRSAKYEDVLWTALVDGSQLQLGDFLVGLQTYFVASMDPLLPIGCVRCNRVVMLTRENPQTSGASGGSAGGLPSQGVGAGSYFGSSGSLVTNATDTGRRELAIGVPCMILGTQGRATGTGELPSDSPGPSRWRIHLPVSVAPKGFVQDRDIVIDEEGASYQVSAAVWTPLGYRAEAIKLEN